uniref:Uncharacterized protein n=1 Tax=Arundo donax TaxID=35708 RepID=A0A0A9FS27_ARUDO
MVLVHLMRENLFFRVRVCVKASSSLMLFVCVYVFLPISLSWCRVAVLCLNVLNLLGCDG